MVISARVFFWAAFLIFKTNEGEVFALAVNLKNNPER
jgi:hypothetical protein